MQAGSTLELPLCPMLFLGCVCGKLVLLPPPPARPVLRRTKGLLQALGGLPSKAEPSGAATDPR